MTPSVVRGLPSSGSTLARQDLAQTGRTPPFPDHLMSLVFALPRDWNAAAPRRFAPGLSAGRASSARDPAFLDDGPSGAGWFRQARSRSDAGRASSRLQLTGRYGSIGRLSCQLQRCSGCRPVGGENLYTLQIGPWGRKQQVVEAQGDFDVGAKLAMLDYLE